MGSLREELARRTMSPTELIKEAEERGRVELEKRMEAEKLANESALASSIKPVNTDESLLKQAESVLGDIDSYLKGDVSTHAQKPDSTNPQKIAEKNKTAAVPAIKKAVVKPEAGESAASLIIKMAMQQDAIASEARIATEAAKETVKTEFLTEEKLASLDIDEICRNVVEKMAMSPLVTKALIGLTGVGVGAGVGAGITHHNMKGEMENYIAADAVNDQRSRLMYYKAGGLAMLNRLRGITAEQGAQNG